MSSHDMENPYGGVNMGHVMESPDPDEHLLERILSRENMLKAWKQSLLAGTYQPLPVRRVEIPKPTGGTRPLGIPSVMDRLIQQAIYQVLMPLFDPDFSDYSYGFRPGRSAHDAVYQARKYIQQGYRVAVDFDLSKFFDTVNHDVLLQHVALKVNDKRVLSLIGKYLRAGVMVKGRLQATRKGVPQGGPLSPLLANV